MPRSIGFGLFLKLRTLSLSLAEPLHFCADWDISLAFKGPSSVGPSLPLVTCPELACQCLLSRGLYPLRRQVGLHFVQKSAGHGSRLSAAESRPAARSPEPGAQFHSRRGATGQGSAYPGKHELRPEATTWEHRGASSPEPAPGAAPVRPYAGPKLA